MSDLKQRTKLFALSIIRLYSQMPKCAVLNAGAQGRFRKKLTV